MLNIQYDLKRRGLLKDLLLRLRNGESANSVQIDLNQYIEDTSMIGLLFIQQVLLNEDEEVTVEDAQNLSRLYTHLLNQDDLDAMHPVNLFKQENTLFQEALKEIRQLLTSLEQVETPETLEALQQKFYQLGEFHKHYHRKEKLLFPILERFGHVQPGRMMWEKDDRIRAFYMGLKSRIDQFSNDQMDLIKRRFIQFQEMFEQMIYEEEAILFPVALELFNEENWQAVAVESEAFGYAMIDVEEVWGLSNEQEKSVHPTHDAEENLRFGGGYLTTKEANMILNNLPLEITFVDKHNLFKYFNDMSKASEMMLVRTPLSIGRNVANCHPPKSLRKVMTLMRELISGKRESESMWFKKNGQYIHITYKALYDEDGEYVGILEYVQNIQPFLELPEEVKMGLSPIVE